MLTSKPLATSPIVFRTKGRMHGPFRRLIGPSDLAAALKPFVLLDLFQFDGAGPRMPLHPHSGIATVTVFTEGKVCFHDVAAGSGLIDYGGVEWMRSGGGVWHGQELSAGLGPRLQGFQLWLALPPTLENGPAESAYLEASSIPTVGPARLIIGAYGGFMSPIDAPAGINYLLVTLRPNQHWIYEPPRAHEAIFLAVASGQLDADESVASGELVAFAPGTQQIKLQATGLDNAVFVLGSAVRHPHDLVMGHHSIHTNREALRLGESRIAELERRMPPSGPSGDAVPVHHR